MLFVTEGMQYVTCEPTKCHQSCVAPEITSVIPDVIATYDIEAIMFGIDFSYTRGWV